MGSVMTWSPWKPSSIAHLDIEFCPMLWSAKQIWQFEQLVKPGYAHCAMGPNEPNQAGQSNMDAHYAVQLWKQYLQPLHNQGYTLISPACTNAPSGKTWMTTFMTACTGCTVDAIATHFYGTSADALIAHVTDLHNTFGRPIWVTEYACQNFSGGAQCSMDETWAFTTKVVAFMDSTSWVHRYFPFGFLTDMGNVAPVNRLMDWNYHPTPLGEFYRWH
jgi:hypothetical protein